ncbi:hypothetical protein D9C73_024938 [Collichthys lucidus]|uniref:Uncharacterized protein n=1 Tax=Collichthys lucidus TaxID=240159 RepID=A0A4U5VTX7_COLLU|nr:hypothetical protein D9C73_024938 [Collichthys lucidus]
MGNDVLDESVFDSRIILSLNEFHGEFGDAAVINTSCVFCRLDITTKWRKRHEVRQTAAVALVLILVRVSWVSVKGVTARNNTAEFDLSRIPELRFQPQWAAISAKKALRTHCVPAVHQPAADEVADAEAYGRPKQQPSFLKSDALPLSQLLGVALSLKPAHGDDNKSTLNRLLRSNPRHAAFTVSGCFHFETTDHESFMKACTKAKKKHLIVVHQHVDESHILQPFRAQDFVAEQIGPPALHQFRTYKHNVDFSLFRGKHTDNIALILLLRLAWSIILNPNAFKPEPPRSFPRVSIILAYHHFGGAIKQAATDTIPSARREGRITGVLLIHVPSVMHSEQSIALYGEDGFSAEPWTLCQIRLRAAYSLLTGAAFSNDPWGISGKCGGLPQRLRADIFLPRLVSIQPIADILTFNALLFGDCYHLPWQRHVSNGYLALREAHKNRIYQVQGHLTFMFPIVAAADEQLDYEEDCP